MPRTPFRAEWAAFDKGLNNRMDPAFLGTGESQDAESCDLLDGTLRGMVGIGNPLEGIAVGEADAWIYFTKSGTWISDPITQFALISGDETYRTNRYSATNASYPTVIDASGTNRLGLVAPTGLAQVTTNGAGTLNGSFRWAITYVTADGLESNPLYFDTVSGLVGAKWEVTLGALPDSRITAVNVYRTLDGAPAGPLYYVGQDVTLDVVSDTGAPDIGDDVLDWGPGGNPGNSALFEDHSPAPNLTLLANAMHSVTGGAGTAGAGIAFGAIDNVVRCSALDQSAYWPTVNEWPLPETVEALVTGAAQTLAFTQSSVYAFEGVDDYNMSMGKTRAGFGIRTGCGATAATTPFGIVFLAREGLAVYRDGSTDIISEGVLSRSYLAALTNPFAVYSEGYYILFHTTGCLVVDLSIWPALKVMPFALTALAAHFTFLSGPGGQVPGLFVLQRGDGGQIRGWSITQSMTVYGPSDVVSTFAGSNGLPGTGAGYTDDTGTAARFSSPEGLATDSYGNLYVADYGNNRIRKVTPAGVVTTLAGSGAAATTDGTGTAAAFNKPIGLTVAPDGNLYVCEELGHVVRKVTPSGVVTTFAGTAGVAGTTDATGTAANFRNPSDIVADADGNLYVADNGNHALRKITPDAVVSTVAGTTGTRGGADGTGTAATFDFPGGICLGVDGHLYMTCAGPVNLVVPSYDGVVKITLPDYVVTTMGGRNGTRGWGDGTGAAASFRRPQGIGSDSFGNLYVADQGNSVIRKITPAGVVTTFAGPTDGSATTGATDGAGAVARFYTPGGLDIDPSGILYVADTDNHRIRKLAALETTYSGDPQPWHWQTGDHIAGDRTKRKTYTRIWADVAGTVSIGIYVDGTLAKTWTPSATENRAWLPQGTVGRKLSLRISSADGTGVLREVVVDGEVG